MKHLFLFITILLIFSNCDSQSEISNPTYQLLPPFARTDDTILISIDLDTVFRPIGFTTFAVDPDYYAGYSNGIDSVFFRGFLPNKQLADLDTIGLRALIQEKYGWADSVKNIDIKIVDHELIIYFEQIDKNNHLLYFDIVQKKNNIFIGAIYQTRAMDQLKARKFKDLCESMKFKVLKRIHR